MRDKKKLPAVHSTYQKEDELVTNGGEYTDSCEIISHCTGNTKESTSVIYRLPCRYTEVADKKTV